MSDAFPSVPVADSEGGAIVGLRRFQSRFMLAGGDDVDVGAGGAFGGAGEDEGADDTAERVDAIEYTFSLQASRIVAVIQIFEHRQIARARCFRVVGRAVVLRYRVVARTRCFRLVCFCAWCFAPVFSPRAASRRGQLVPGSLEPTQVNVCVSCAVTSRPTNVERRHEPLGGGCATRAARCRSWRCRTPT